MYEIRICCRVKPSFKICYDLKTVFKKPTDKGPLQNSNILLKSVQKTNETTPKIVTYFLSVGGTFYPYSWTIFIMHLITNSWRPR